jgi:nucleotide-binding universal stress UspA family protein
MNQVTRILVPTDFSPASDAALEYARALAVRMGASICLVHAFDDPFASGAFVGDGTVMMPVDLRRRLEDWAREQLAVRYAAIAETLPGCSIVMLTGSPAKRIVEQAENIGADLVVMGTHGRTGLGHLFIGSVAERVVRTAKCPVLTTRAAESATPRVDVVAAAISLCRSMA